MAWDLNKAVQYSQMNALSGSHGRCAEKTRLAIEAGGVTLVHHGAAKDYGSSLLLAGFRVYTTNYIAILQKGDVVIFQGFTNVPGTKKEHPHGHMAMYDGAQWISDFRQHHFYPGHDHMIAKPPFVIYRYGFLSDGVKTPSGRSYA